MNLSDDDKDFTARWHRVAKHTRLTQPRDLPRMRLCDLLGIFLDTAPGDPLHQAADKLLRRRLRPKKKAAPFKLLPSTRTQGSYLGEDPNYLRASNNVIIDDVL